MISKPLLKQSIKANWIIWIIVTFATCFMLGSVILILGNLNVDEIRGSLTNAFTEDYVKSQIKKNAMTYYTMTDGVLLEYDNNIDGVKALSGNVISSFDTAIKQYGDNPTIEQKQEVINAISGGFQDAKQKAMVGAILNIHILDLTKTSDIIANELLLNNIANATYESIKIEYGEETAIAMKSLIGTAISQYLVNLQSPNPISKEDFETNYVSNALSVQMKDKLKEYNFTEMQIFTTASSGIVEFRTRISIEYPNTALSQIEKSKIDLLVKDLTKSLADEMPEKVANSLKELGEMDIYGLVIGSIFFKISGLLLPIVYTIMTANNLIAGQVDSGSMAYVLSTPTKRKKVTITQMFFLIGSLFAMFLMTTLTSVICMSLVNNVNFTITIGQMLLFNLGAFMTMFAFSGICFLASAWFNRSKNSLAVGGGISIFFLVATILGLFGSSVVPNAIRIGAMNFFNYLSIITLFDSASILENSLIFLWKFAILFGIGLITYIISVVKFDKKDLPL